MLRQVAADGGIPLTEEEAVMITKDAASFWGVRQLLLSEIGRRAAHALAVEKITASMPGRARIKGGRAGATHMVARGAPQLQPGCSPCEPLKRPVSQPAGSAREGALAAPTSCRSLRVFLWFSLSLRPKCSESAVAIVWTPASSKN